ncbi:MAG: type III-B CRISPR module RAMP protein Cmr6 [Thermogutta sp.]|uniref:type III-B CRISPR module RAMP protein Cmr6 n=1 Tax=Thermogutta sp. TaxID=1962930 RepID=UPI0019C04681|nr:type III-B CRISPR module RAMP protein Cmr6 [Thermogutta sp.]
MAMIVPLPKSVRDLLRDNTHLGLQLDKYVESWDEELFSKPGADTGKLSERVQKPTVELIASKSRTEPPGLNYADLFARWQAVAAAREAMTFKAETVGPLTLHLARASALENAGICLHPIYGFVYLPGTGLKGMARAFAETVWLPTQTDQKKAWQQIEDVFGWAPNPDRIQQIRDPNHPAEVRHDPSDPRTEITASSGQIIFLDAWPEKWTPLVVDILNNHHASYYQNQEPPGDWDSPIPVYFLAVSAGHTFFFALAKRRADVPDELLQLATEWLIGALEYEGAGAKTASGYGSFKLTEPPKLFSSDNIDKTWKGAIAKQKRKEFTCTLELVTPAFLAGPLQKEEDCELRPATLRGMLRWWWRTMHAAHVDAVTLYRMESAIWGDTNSCGAVRVTVEPVTESIERIPMPGKKIIEEIKNGKERSVLRRDPGFFKVHAYREPGERETQGLLYLSYGMDEMPANRSHERKTRYVVLPGAKWDITFIARPGMYFSPEEIQKKPGERTGIPLSPDLLLSQALAALWLLTHYGGVGSKSRNGFGCFADLEVDGCHGLEDVHRLAEEFRRECKVEKARQESIGSVVPALPEVKPGASEAKQRETAGEMEWQVQRICDNVDLAKHYWFVLDYLGYCVQEFCQKYKRNWHKEALGLPRHVRCSNRDGQQERGYIRDLHKTLKCDVVWLGQKHEYAIRNKEQVQSDDFQKIRHASPYFIHVGKTKDGRAIIRVIAFPCAVLPDDKISAKMLSELLEHLRSKLDEFAIRECMTKAENTTLVTEPKVEERGQVRYQKRKHGTPTKVQIVKIEEGKKFRVKEEGYPEGVLTLGSPPDPLPNVGDMVEVEVHDDNPRCPQYRWPKRNTGKKK